MYKKINNNLLMTYSTCLKSISTNNKKGFCTNIFDSINNNYELEDYFFNSVTNENEYWEVDYVNSKKKQKDTSKTIYLNEIEQKKLHELVEKYEKYRASLSPKDREILDKNKKIGIISSRWFSNNKWEEFQKFYNNKDFSKMTKHQLLDLLQYTDTSDMGIDGKIGSFRQGQVGDCWLIATLRNISHSKENSEILKNSITKNNDNTYTVKFKGINRYIKEQAFYDFMNKFNTTKTGKEINEEVEKKFPNLNNNAINYKKIFTDENYKPQNDAEKYFYDLYKKNKNNDDIKQILNEKEQFIKENTNYFKDGIKISKERLDANFLINECGDNANYSTGDQDATLIEMAVEEVRKKVNGVGLEGGSSKLGNILLLDKESDYYSTEYTPKEIDNLHKLLKEGLITQEEFERKMSFKPLSNEEKNKWINILENSNPEQLTISSIPATENEEKNAKTNPEPVFFDLKSDKLGNRKIRKGHAYNIAYVDKENKIIYVENPWENGIKIPLTYDEFFSSFNQLFVLEK